MSIRWENNRTVCVKEWPTVIIRNQYEKDEYTFFISFQRGVYIFYFYIQQRMICCYIVQILVAMISKRLSEMNPWHRVSPSIILKLLIEEFVYCILHL